MGDNKMMEIGVEKVTLNIGAGEAGEKLENAKTLLERVSNRTPVLTTAKIRNPVFKIKKGDVIGTKVTLRGKEALAVLQGAFKAAENRISRRSFDRNGNFSFGVKEYIDFPGVKYDPKIGIIGFDVCVTLKRGGLRTVKRKRARARIGKKHRISQDEGVRFVENMGVKVE